MVTLLKAVNMLEATYKQVMVWLKQMKEEADLGDLPEDDYEVEEVDFN